MAVEWKDIVNVKKDLRVASYGAMIKVDSKLYKLVKDEATMIGKTPAEFFNERILCHLIKDIERRL